jgi:RimJ/RimL family protein N-acetyltransferase
MRSGAEVADFAIRPLRRDELEALYDLLEAVAAERRWIASEPPIPRERWREQTLEYFEDPHCLFVVAVDEQERIIGELSAFGRDQRPADLGMSVAKPWRGRGVGTALLQTSIDWARDQGVHKLALQVWPHNDAALRLYEKFGFEREGILRSHYRRQDGELWDAIVMGLLLD